MENIIKYIELIILILLPGFISNRLYNLVCQRERILDGRFQYTILIWGALNYAIIYPFIGDAHLRDLNILVYYLIVLVLPVITGILISVLRYNLPLIIRLLSGYSKGMKSGVLTPLLASLERFGIEQVWPTAWNKVFSQNKGYWVKAHLKDGSVISGFYGKNSYVSTYPVEEQVYLEKVFILDENNEFDKELDGSDGVIIFKSELVALELFQVQYEREKIE